MTAHPLSLTHPSNQELLTEVKRRAQTERDATASLIASLVELDARRLFLGEGCSSLFTYCTRVLHLSEHAAFLRIEAARAARRFPVILQLLAQGAIHLTAISLLAPHLTDANHAAILEEARHKSKREVEEIVCPRAPAAGGSSIGPEASAAESHRTRHDASARPELQYRRGIAVSAVGSTAPDAPGGSESTRTGTLQGSVHCEPRDARHTPASAGPAAAHDSERGPGRDL